MKIWGFYIRHVVIVSSILVLYWYYTASSQYVMYRLNGNWNIKNQSLHSSECVHLTYWRFQNIGPLLLCYKNKFRWNPTLNECSSRGIPRYHYIQNSSSSECCILFWCAYFFRFWSLSPWNKRGNMFFSFSRKFWSEWFMIKRENLE